MIAELKTTVVIYDNRNKERKVCISEKKLVMTEAIKFSPKQN